MYLDCKAPIVKYRDKEFPEDWVNIPELMPDYLTDRVDKKLLLIDKKPRRRNGGNQTTRRPSRTTSQIQLETFIPPKFWGDYTPNMLRTPYHRLFHTPWSTPKYIKPVLIYMLIADRIGTNKSRSLELIELS